MPSSIRRGCLLLLGLPAAAFAAPIIVVTHSTGTASVNPTVLYALGQEETPTEYEQPYALTLTSTFDWTGPLPARGEGPYYHDAEVVVDFRIGGHDYHYAGNGSSSVDVYTPYMLGGDSYRHEISVDPNPNAYGYSFSFGHVFHGPAGSMGPGGALAPGTIEGGSSPGGYLDITAYYSNDEYTFLFPMSGDIGTYSVHVTSPVPEPASAGLLAAGLLALALRRRVATAPRT